MSNKQKVLFVLDEDISMDNDNNNIHGDENIYEVEKIHKYRKYKYKKKHLVKWVGYDNDQNSWLRENDFQNKSLIIELKKV